jgi:NADPH2:quinone reductase
MKALRIHRFGEPLVLDDVDEPRPEPGERVVDIEYAGVDPLDVWLATGRTRPDLPLPWIPGTEATGRVDGRRVLVWGHGLGVRRPGLYAERAAVPEDALLPLPDGVDPVQVAAVPVAGRTAWRLVHDVARVQGGETVLVLGASGGVGSLILQLARRAGATAYGQTGSPAKAGWIRDQGAEDVLVCGPDELAGLAGALRPQVVFDPLGDGFTAAAVEALAPHGRVAIFGASAGDRADVNVRAVYSRGLSILSYAGLLEPEREIRPVLEKVVEALAQGRLHVPIDDVIPLEQGAEAHRRILQRAVRGKLVLSVGERS